MTPLAPIPSPPSVLWREFRIRYLPPAAFLVVLAITAFLWRRQVGPSQWVGQVEQVRATVSTHQSGRIVQLRAAHLQNVVSGEPLVQIMVADPRVLEAQLALSRARIDFVRASIDPKLRKENNVINFEQLRLDWMEKRVQLATARSRLHFNESEFERTERLYKLDTNSIISIHDMDVARRDVDVTRAEADGLAVLVQEMDAAIRIIEPMESKLDDDLPGSVQAAIAVEERQLNLIEAQLAPVTLTAPIDGVVTIVHHQNGESLMPGDPILTITATPGKRILAYVRQPLNMEARVDQPIEIRARSTQRASGVGRILVVGSALEAINPELLPMSAGGSRPAESGLPVLVSIPDGFRVYPGEIVDLRPVGR